MDLGTELATGRYLRLIELIDSMPKACRWREAADQDEDYIAGLTEEASRQLGKPVGVEDDDPEDTWQPPASEFKLINIQLNRVIDLLGDVLGSLGANIKPEQYRFPVPFDPWAEAMARADAADTDQRAGKALSSLLKKQ